MKCLECGFENSDDAVFCEDCGARIPKEKECPDCHFKAALNAKFCKKCGHRFGANAQAAHNAGVSIGDKNVIAGDVISSASSAGASSAGGVSMGDKNVIAGDVIGKKLVVEKGATFINNEDETKRLVQCHICKRNMAIADSIECPRCHEFVCEHCYDRKALLCLHCKEEEYKALQRAAARGDKKAKSRFMKVLMDKLDMKVNDTVFLKYIYSEQVKDFVIPDGITEIGERAFSESNIVSVEIPSSVKTIHDGAFFKCHSLQRVILHDGLKTIGEYAFQGCEKLSEIILPESVRTIEIGALSVCPSLQKVILNEGLEIIGEEAFWQCGSLSEITIPGSVKTIEKSAFRECSNLQRVVLHEGLKTIGEFAFQECNKLSEITIPNTVKTIEKYALSRCPSLQKVILNEGLETIGECAFWQCGSLSEITIPRSVKTIEESAFDECSSLSSLRVPSSTLLGNDVFEGKIIRI